MTQQEIQERNMKEALNWWQNLPQSLGEYSRSWFANTWFGKGSFLMTPIQIEECYERFNKMKRNEEFIKYLKMKKITYTLHKLQEGFVVTSDEEIKKGDNIECEGKIAKVDKILDEDSFPFLDNSTGWRYALSESQKVIAQEDQIDFSALSEAKRKRIEWFDAEKLAEEFVINKVKMSSQAPGVLVGYIEGFQKHKELTSDKRFTEEDIARAFLKGCQSERMLSNRGKDLKNYIQSLSQPKSWQVEGHIENDKFKITKIL